MNKLYLAITLVVVTTAATAHPIEPSDSLTRELQEVVVSAKQPATKLVGTTLVSTIAGSNLQNIGTSLDVLAQLPMITVNDGDVTVIGKGIPDVFIDGHPMRDGDELLQLQSNNIRKIELLMAPGAMYSGTAKAVLRITTRHNFLDGLSLKERAEVTTRRKWSANDMLDLDYHTGKWEFFASGIAAHNNSCIKGTTINTLNYNGMSTVVGSSQNHSYPSNNGTAKGGLNYSDGTQSLGFYYRYNLERGDFKNYGSEWLNDETPINRNIFNDIRAHGNLVSAYYDNTFAGKYNLHFDGNYRNTTTHDKVNTIYPQAETADVYSTTIRHASLWAGKLYLAFPLWQGNFTVGTQDSHTYAGMDYKMLNTVVGQYIPSSLTDAWQTSLAAFALWNRTFGKFNMQAGLRYEYLDYLLKINNLKDNNVSRTDNLLTPDISLGWTFSDRTQISLSYRMSKIKPPYSQLTGSLSYTGIHEIEGGNPALRDEKTHDVQLFGMWRDFMLQADYTRSDDTYAFVKCLYPANTLQLLMRPININVSALDIYLVWSKQVKFWTPEMTFGMHKQWLELDGSTYNQPIVSYYFDNTMLLPHDFILTFNARGQTHGDMHTNRFGTTWFTANVSVGKSFLNKSLQIKLSSTDIFNTANNDWTMNTYGIVVDKHQSYDRRGISLSITYNLHPRQSKYIGNPASEAEMNRF